MAEERYLLRSTGLREDVDPRQACEQLTAALRLNEEQLQALLEKTPKVVKKKLGRDAAERYHARLWQLGLNVAIEVMLDREAFVSGRRGARIDRYKSRVERLARFERRTPPTE